VEAISNVEPATYGRKTVFGVIWPQSQTKSQSAPRSASQRHTSHTHVTQGCAGRPALLCTAPGARASRRASSRPGPQLQPFCRLADAIKPLLRLAALRQGAERL